MLKRIKIVFLLYQISLPNSSLFQVPCYGDNGIVNSAVCLHRVKTLVPLSLLRKNIILIIISCLEERENSVLYIRYNHHQ